MNKFMEASKLALRFKTAKGNLSVEDLWQLDLSDLDSLALELDMQKIPTKSFRKEDITIDKIVELKLAIIIAIIKHKEKEKELAEKAKIRLAEINYWKELLSNKKLREDKKLSIKEIEAKLAKL